MLTRTYVNYGYAITLSPVRSSLIQSTLLITHDTYVISTFIR